MGRWYWDNLTVTGRATRRLPRRRSVLTNWAWFDLVLAALVLIWTLAGCILTKAATDAAVSAQPTSLQAASWLWQLQLAAISCWCHVAGAVGLIIASAGLLEHAAWSLRWALRAALGYLLIDVTSVVVGWAVGGLRLGSPSGDDFAIAAGYLTVWLLLLREVLVLRSDEARLALQGAEQKQVI